ncbi:MAG: hypothetical protein AAF902_21650 [Chloroflexota bacterium]
MNLIDKLKTVALESVGITAQKLKVVLRKFQTHHDLAILLGGQLVLWHRGK